MPLYPPYGINVVPKSPAPEAQESVDEFEEEKQSLEKLSAKTALRRDEIGELLHAHYYIQSKTFWDVVHPFNKTSAVVTRYYPEPKVAVDIFQRIGADENREIVWKREAFRKIGIKYAAVDWTSDVASIKSQVTKIWPF